MDIGCAVVNTTGVWVKLLWRLTGAGIGICMGKTMQPNIYINMTSSKYYALKRQDGKPHLYHYSCTGWDMWVCYVYLNDKYYSQETDTPIKAYEKLIAYLKFYKIPYDTNS